MEYKILTEDTAGDLSIAVNDYLTCGWVLHGSPSAVCFNQYGSVMFIQAITKTEPCMKAPRHGRTWDL